MKRLIRCARWLIVAIFSMGAAACGAMRTSPALTPTPAIVQLSADQIAKAAQENRPILDNRNQIIHVTGIVEAVSQKNGQTVVELETSVDTGVRCYLDAPSTAPQVGASVTFESTDPEPEDGAVGLQHCKAVAP